MNYFTKEWYELCQKTNAHLCLEEEKQAKFFSEKYFQQLYNEKLTEFLDLWKRVSYISNEPFDREKLSKQFEEGFEYNQEHIKKTLPKNILKKIADIRVYALDKASHQVIKDLTRFCENNRALVNRTIREYKKYYKKALKSFDKEMIKYINFHDCRITDIRKSEQSLSILFDNSGGFTDIYEIQFEDYKIIKQDAVLQNSWWLYDEIYKKNGKYELQVLLLSENNDLVEFSVSAEHFFFKHNREK